MYPRDMSRLKSYFCQLVALRPKHSVALTLFDHPHYLDGSIYLYADIKRIRCAHAQAKCPAKVETTVTTPVSHAQQRQEDPSWFT